MYRGIWGYTSISRFGKQKCIYCDFPAYQNLEDITILSVCLGSRNDYVRCAYPKSRTKLVDTVYFGGGTPTELSLLQLEQILNTIKTNYNVSPDCQFTIESNPGEVDRLI